MFENKRYLTRGVDEKIPVLVQLVLWELVDKLPKEKRDYLQVFSLVWHEGKMTVTRSQEVPSYKKTYVFVSGKTEKTEKVYIIDNGDYLTMLLAEEY